MTNCESWILLDTETTGFSKPIFVVDVAAQKMSGWERDGEPFRRMLNHGCVIPAEAAQVNGFTREILERDGSMPAEVYEEFAAYAGSLPLVAYNLEYDWDKVLLPEWKRLGISQIGVPGFCALKLAQRLLDPVPAGNCKLQTLRQYFRLPENGAHTALGDVLTVIDLMQQVLRPLAEKRGLDTWEKIVGFAGDEWFPSRLPFGKFKGRLYQEARAWLADLELEYGIEKSKVDSIRSRLFGALRAFYQKRDRLRLLVQFRKAFIDRLLAEGEDTAGATAGDYQREAAEKDR